MPHTACPCQSGLAYPDCCAPYHQGRSLPPDAEALMRSRYSAYALQQTGYLVATTVPAQQALLNTTAIDQWSRNSQWLGLQVYQHRRIGQRHAQVAFSARFQEAGGAPQTHEELSAFVLIDRHWYFIDPTVPLPGMKQPCFCGSGKKFKACCGQFFSHKHHATMTKTQKAT